MQMHKGRAVPPVAEKSISGRDTIRSLCRQRRMPQAARFARRVRRRVVEAPEDLNRGRAAAVSWAAAAAFSQGT